MPDSPQANSSANTGTSATTSAARPDGTLVSARHTKPLTRPIIMKPINAPLRHCSDVGHAAPRHFRNVNRIGPAHRLRIADEINGGMPSTTKWMARYVEPQTT